MINRITPKISFLIVFCLWQFPVSGQHIHDSQIKTTYETFQKIDRDVRDGRLTVEEGLLSKFYQAFEPEKLQTEYQTGSEFIRCLTPVLIEYSQNKNQLSKLAENQIGNYLTTSSVTDTAYSESGRFRLMYTTSGTDSVSVIDSTGSGIPDYIEKAALYADSSWHHQVAELGFREFVKEEESYSIYFRKLSDGFYGFTQSGNSTTQIVVHSTFENFPPNDDPEGLILGSLKATIAHEMKHAIQYATNRWRGDAGSFNWVEMDATLMEEIVFPAVNDYHNYLPADSSIFKAPQKGTPGAYLHITWSLYFAENFGMQFWVDVWEKIAANQFKPMMDAVRETVEENGDSFSRQFIRNYMWHYASGSNSRAGYGFNEREDYPNAVLATDSQQIPETLGALFTVNRQAARFHKIKAGPQDEGQVLVALFHDEPNTGVGLLAFKKDSTIAELIPAPDSSGTLLIKTDWEWENLDKLVLTTVNFDASNIARTRLLAGSGEGIEKMRYGDVLEDGNLFHEDIREILASVAGLRDPYFTATRLIADVSGNGDVTAYDAALILKHLAGDLPRFTIDKSGSGYGPEYEDFQSFPEMAKHTFMAAGSDSVNDSLTFSMETLSADVTENGDLDIAVNLSNTDSTLFSSAYLEIHYSEFLEFQEIITEDTQNGEALVEYNHSGADRLIKIALAQPGYFGDGRVLTLRFEPEMEGSDVYASFLTAKLDEISPAFKFEHSDSMSVGPRKPVTAPIDERPLIVALDQNYPNPFNPATTISFSLPEAQHASLIVYDITGREVMRLADGMFSPGNHAFVFNAVNLSSGIYVYRLHTAGSVETRKMMLVK